MLILQIPPIATDRPDFTEGATTVPHNTTQIEMGLTFEDKAYVFPEALLRHSIDPRLELRAALLDHREDPALGFKYALNDNSALIAMSTRGTPLVALAWATNGNLAGQIQAEFPGARTDLRHTLVYSAPLTHDINAFAEHVFDFADHSRPAHIAHFGLTHHLNNDQQIDFHFGIPLTKETRHFLGAGFSTRL
jgi:hypothetical protein